MYGHNREQWPVSVRMEDLEGGAFELPASGLFVVQDDYIIPASRVEMKAYIGYPDALEDASNVSLPSTVTYTLLPDFSFPQESSDSELAELGYSRLFRSGLRNTFNCLTSYKRIVNKARRVFAAFSGRA
ncbi:hypothetical protein EIP91_000915 [Steccherinum ochraceum]|uniref:Uncharacterized protein n=1 Tax=Steccherinum ochraceum TaxID=92696 RepID=A0A4V2MWM5_9APHY|nr:hypothetical protein EIP91_000915 [Steccherinum ochraceum]